jgi:hypothetical protein
MTQASPFWLSLATLAPIFNVSIQIQISDGLKTQFWHDNWLQGPLICQYQQLYEQSRYKEVSVYQCSQHGQWSLYTQTNLTPQAQQQLAQLHLLLSEVQSQ